eukprot:TRINITY_DN76589_c0_g1_i2.p1 TRINITY_DN76589_c0_g1~~TRINITY_DN76589_c0_g1_i2.p1  ORF type:complete len:155 (-),score=36.03 TRINITY_DN76589_c0_g1_i2:392-856(-)
MENHSMAEKPIKKRHGIPRFPRTMHTMQHKTKQNHRKLSLFYLFSVYSRARVLKRKEKKKKQRKSRMRWFCFVLCCIVCIVLGNLGIPWRFLIGFSAIEWFSILSTTGLLSVLYLFFIFRPLQKMVSVEVAASSSFPLDLNTSFSYQLHRRDSF